MIKNKSKNAGASKVTNQGSLKPPTYLLPANPTPAIHSPQVLTVKGWCKRNHLRVL